MDLGILQLIIPSALAELVARRDCGGLWDGANRKTRVAAASADYRRWCERHRVPTQYRTREIMESWVKGDYPQVSMVHADEWLTYISNKLNHQRNVCCS